MKKVRWGIVSTADIGMRKVTPAMQRGKFMEVTAIASRDYQDVHHDPDLAKKRGSPDIFMNILTTNGFVGRYVTDWTGPDARIRKIDIRLGAPNYPGDTMTLEGKVTAKDETAGTIEISLRGHNRLGDHVTGKVLVSLPA